MTLGSRISALAFWFVGLASAGGPVFSPGISFPTLAGPLASLTGDFNRDGHVDLVVSNTSVDSVSVFLGIGDGTFRPRVDYTVAGCQVGQVIAGDFNRDGNLDLLGTCTLTPAIFVLPGRSDGTFGAPIISEAPLPVVSGFLENFVEPLTAADVNSDGILDLALIIQTQASVGFDTKGAIGQTVIMTGNGDGTFSHPVTLNIAPPQMETYAVQLADVNGDGKVDIVGIAFTYTAAGLTVPLTASLFVALGDGAGGFQLTHTYSLTGSPQTGMMLGDVNGDGKTDVVFAGLSIAAILNANGSADLSGVSVFLGGGDGTFTQSYVTLDSQTVQNQAAIGAALSPVLGSKYPDVVAVMLYDDLAGLTPPTAGIVVRANNGDGTFGTPQPLNAPSTVLPFSIAVADFNGDGSPDVVSFNFTVNLFSLLFGNVDILFSDIDQIGSTIAGFPAATAKVLLNGTLPAGFTNANSASFQGGAVAASSIVSAFGSGLANTTMTAAGLPLPLTLGGTSIAVVDALGVSRAAPLFYVSPTQINYAIPDGTATGAAKVSITRALGTTTVQQSIVAVAPGVFNGNGLAAAQVFTYKGTSPVVVTPTLAVNGQGQLVAAPIYVGTGSTQVYLILYGTGIRNHQAAVVAKVGTTSITAAYAGAQGAFLGEDQVNVLLPQSLKGAGLVSVVLSVDGLSSNAVQVEIQ